MHGFIAFSSHATVRICDHLTSTLRKASGPDITQSATYKMIHGLDEPAPQRPQRHYPEGTAPAPLDACVCDPPSDPTNTDSLHVRHSSPSCNSPTSFAINKVRVSPVNPLSPQPGQTRQGLSFYLLQCLYDSDDSDQDVPVQSGSGSASPTNSVPSNTGTCTDTASDGSLSPTSSTTSSSRNTRVRQIGRRLKRRNG